MKANELWALIHEKQEDQFNRLISTISSKVMMTLYHPSSEKVTWYGGYFKEWDNLPENWRQRLEEMHYHVEVSSFGFTISWLGH